MRLIHFPHLLVVSGNFNKINKDCNQLADEDTKYMEHQLTYFDFVLSLLDFELMSTALE